jgi:hypothetical protein
MTFSNNSEAGSAINSGKLAKIASISGSPLPVTPRKT